jgi:hypothetical protein
MFENNEQLNGLRTILQTSTPDLIAVGNEIAGTVSPAIISDCIDSVRKMLKDFNIFVPVGNADMGGGALSSRMVINKLDFVGVNLYPGTWDNVSQSNMLSILKQSYADELKRFSSKLIILTETGTPYAGEPYIPVGATSTQTPSTDKAASYLKGVVEWSKENSIPLFYFEAFDEKVKAQNHDIEQYFGLMDGETLKIHPFYREIIGSSDTTLKELNVSVGTLSPAFDANTTNYTVNISNEITTVTGVANSIQAEVTIDSETTDIPLEVGDNIVNITVTAGNGVAVKTYTVTIHRISNDASLKGIALSNGELSPLFDINTTNYTVTVDNEITTIDITGTPTHIASTVSGNVTGKSLDVGNNVVEITVTAEDETIRTYYVTVVRNGSPDATLSNLTFNNGKLSPSFDGNTTNYTLNVENEISTISIQGTANHENATVNGNVTDKSIDVGDNVFNITVTAENGATQTYTITVIRNDHVLVTEANLISITVNDKRIDINDLEYKANCNEHSIALNLQASPYSTITIDEAEYTLGQRIDFGDDIKNVNIKIKAETGGAETPYTLKIVTPIDVLGLYFSRWDDVVAINSNQKNNGGISIPAEGGIRWYTQDGTFLSDKAYIVIPASGYYAEILTTDGWRRVCGVPEKASQIVAYPNPIPRGEKLKLQLTETFVNGTLKIYDINGRLQKSGLPLPATNVDVDVSDLSSGIYLMHISGKNKQLLVKKIIIE